MTEISTSWVTLGALFGALVAGELADRWGRRITILFAAGLFTVGAMIEAFAPGPNVLIVGRLVVGFAVGVASVAAPLHAAEMAPARLRRRFVSMYQLAITIGIFVAYLVDQALTNSDSWRLMLFGAAGFDTPQEQAAATTWAIGAVNVLATFIAVIYVDRFGRKPLLQIGLVGMTLSLTVVGICFLSLDSPSDGITSSGGSSMAAVFTLVDLVVFIASFAFSLGPVVWTMINEIYPSRIRGRGVALATAANWGSAWLVSQFFLTLTDAIGQAGTFWQFAAFP